MEEKASATIDINNTYTKINIEKEETAHQRLSLQGTTDLIEKHKAEYIEMKELLASQVSGRVYFYLLTYLFYSELPWIEAGCEKCLHPQG